MSDSATIAKSLKALATDLKQHGNKARFSDQHGWPALPLTVDDLGMLADNLADRITTVSEEILSDEQRRAFERLSVSIEFARSSSVPNIFSNVQAPESILGLLYTAESFLIQAASDGDLKAISGISLRLRNRATVARERLDAALDSVEGIESKLQGIQAAHDAAEELPITQRLLSEAVAAVEGRQKAIHKLELAAAASASEAAKAEAHLGSLSDAAEDYIEKIKGSYRAATSHGLAHAFRSRETTLNNSMLIWVLGLLASLVIAGLVAHARFPQISDAVKGTPDWGVVAVNITLASLSLSPAVWFAWVATTQIGQRFRLAEDYAYKAAISAAYEGYRAEAASLDPLLQAQLFASALGRLDELPLRLIDANVSGSPLHELLASIEFKQAIESVPSLLDRMFAILRRTPSKSGSSAPKPDTTSSAP